MGRARDVRLFGVRDVPDVLAFACGNSTALSRALELLFEELFGAWAKDLVIVDGGGLMLQPREHLGLDLQTAREGVERATGTESKRTEAIVFAFYTCRRCSL